VSWGPLEPSGAAHAFSSFGTGQCISWPWQPPAPLPQHQPKMAQNRNKVCLLPPEGGALCSSVSQPHMCKPGICWVDRWRGEGGEPNQAAGQNGKSKHLVGKKTNKRKRLESCLYPRLHGLSLFICKMANDCYGYHEHTWLCIVT
jgi:hypothetical protein